jgi:predicted nucleic acid-binding protein
MKTAPLDVLLDTDVLWRPSAELAPLVKMAQAGRLRIHLSALVLAERERQLVQREREDIAKGKAIVPGNQVRRFRQWIGQLSFDSSIGPTLPFDQSHAEQVGLLWAGWLDAQPDDYLMRGTGPLQLRKDTAPEVDWTLHKFDWFIAAIAQLTGWVVVTNDQGPAFQQSGVQRMAWSDFVAAYWQNS